MESKWEHTGKNAKAGERVKAAVDNHHIVLERGVG